MHVSRVLDIRKKKRPSGQAYTVPYEVSEKLEKEMKIERRLSDKYRMNPDMLPRNAAYLHFIRQLGLIAGTGGALVCIQPPEAYTPGFGKGPVTRVMNVKKKRVKLAGNYERFPTLPRFKDAGSIKYTTEGMPSISTYDFRKLWVAASSPISEEEIREYFANRGFSSALKNVFDAVNFSFSDPVFRLAYALQR